VETAEITSNRLRTTVSRAKILFLVPHKLLVVVQVVAMATRARWTEQKVTLGDPAVATLSTTAQSLVHKDIKPQTARLTPELPSMGTPEVPWFISHHKPVPVVVALAPREAM
jgi:hypothetical protein